MNNATSIIIVIICFIKVFVNATKSLEVSKTQNNEAVEMIKDDEMCFLCHEEKLTVKFLPCLHKIGNECASRLFAYGHKYCPLCKTEIMMLSNYVDKGICYRCEDEKLTVTFKPCGHKIGNNCAYRMHVLNQKSCPFCENYINEFENLCKPYIPALNKPDIELCVCCTEKTSRTIQPCNHLVGYECGSIIDDADIISCPICNQVVNSNTVNQNPVESPNMYSSELDGYHTGMALNSEINSPIILSHYQTPFAREFSTDSPGSSYRYIGDRLERTEDIGVFEYIRDEENDITDVADGFSLSEAQD
ncbi:E3 ubiquitin-protein ligase MIB1-like isoform X4 [Daktulosphaira vitifoliae]|uniref:E3 ubiquitin-protein ligase MIB1-like isoform X4 n=1 Tax=Daktulosphaira vitifoliae TaxID=58002 RepID=UPI0021AA7710|nr:E3 ubiquitin-protein ligase MIB1-like isoform X4 [Daktulosphaira vitifoliae]